MRTIFISTASILAMSSPSFAQSSAPVQAQEGGISEIVVTASKREENIQKSALSIQAISSQELARANVSKPEDLSSLAPGLQVGTGSNFPQAYIRGVGSFNTQTAGDSAVAFNIDGVFVSRPWAARGAFYDLERVEVLKGPQGTLYGRNALGGAINIISARPRIGEASGFLEVGAGNYNLIEGTAAINVPLGETLAMRVSGRAVSRDGYLSDGYMDDKGRSARLQLLWKPNDDVSLLLSASVADTGGKGAGPVLRPRINGEKFIGASDPRVVALIKADPRTGALATFPKDNGFLDINAKAFLAELNWNLGFATLTVLPAYRESTLDSRSFMPGFEVINSELNKQTTIEARLSGNSEKLKWVVGAYYFNEDGSNQRGRSNLLVLQGVAVQEQPTLDLNSRSYALFGQATYSLTDTLRVTGGIRYSYERKNFKELYQVYSFPDINTGQCGPLAQPGFTPASPYPPLFCLTNVNNNSTRTDKSVTWKAGFEYDLAERSMFYANVSTGFKSGGFYSAPPPNDFAPEKLLAFDVGVKNRFLDNRLQVNLEAFFWKYTNRQESYVGPTSAGFFTFTTVNAGRAKSYGADLDVLFKATPNDELTLKVQYNETKYTEFKYPWAAGAFGPAVTGCATTPFAPPADQIVDCAGFPLTRAPKWSGLAGYAHTFDLGDSGNIRFAAELQFGSGSFNSIDFISSGSEEAYAMGNFDLAYTTANGKVTVSAFVRNVGNQEVANSGIRYPFTSPTAARPEGLFFAVVRPPRTFGGKVRVEF